MGVTKVSQVLAKMSQLPRSFTFAGRIRFLAGQCTETSVLPKLLVAGLSEFLPTCILSRAQPSVNCISATQQLGRVLTHQLVTCHCYFFFLIDLRPLYIVMVWWFSQKQLHTRTSCTLTMFILSFLFPFPISIISLIPPVLLSCF